MNDVQKAKGFDEFWSEYPRKVARLTAKRAYEKAIKNHVDHETLMAGLRQYVKHLEQHPRERQFIKHASTWLNGGCWDDELEVRDEMSTLKFEEHRSYWLRWSKNNPDRSPPPDIQRMFNLGSYAKGAE